MPALELLLDLTLKSSLVFVAGGLAAAALHGESASSRHLVWTATVCAALLLPVGTALAPSLTTGALPSWDVGIWRVGPAGVTTVHSGSLRPPTGGEPGPAVNRPKTASTVHPVAGTGEVDEARSGERGTASSDAGELTRTAGGAPSRVPTALVSLVWLAGAGLVLSVLAVERWRLWRLKRRSRRVRRGPVLEEAGVAARRLGVDRRVTVHVAPSSTVPMTWGVLVPSLLLPSDAEQWPAERLRTVFLHELAHVRRRDALTQSVAALACVLYWFHPLAWLAARSMRRERERAADDLVLASGASGPTYAGQLVELARSLSPGAMTDFAAVSMVRRSQLSERVEAVLDADRSRRQPGNAAVGGTLLAGLVAVAGLVVASPAASSSSPPATAIEAAVRLPGGAGAASPARPSPTGTAPDTLPRCWREDGPRSLDVHTNTRYREVTREDEECSANIRVEGRLGFDPSFSRLTTVSPGGRIVIEERDANGMRRLEVRRGAGGRPAYEYRENDEVVGTDDRAEQEFHSRLLVLFRYGGVAARDRASWLLESDGVDRVVAEARGSPPDPVAAEYLTAALRSGRLEQDRIVEIAEIVRRGIGSDRSAAEVLAVLFETQPRVASGPARAALERAMASVGSDGEHVRLLRQVLTTGPSGEAVLVFALASAEAHVGSDGVMDSFLRWTIRNDGERLSAPGPNAAFHAALSTIGSEVTRERLTSSFRRAGGAPSAPSTSDDR